MAHSSCAFKTVTENDTINPLRKLWRKVIESTLVSSSNPFSLHYFRSPIAIKKERERQLKITSFVIHPYSSFREMYDIYLIFLYCNTLITNSLQFGFVRKRHYEKLNFYFYYVLVMRILFLLHIPLNMFFGFTRKGSNTMELRFPETAKRYLYGPYFICDVLSSVPAFSIYLVDRFNGYRVLLGVVNLLALFCIVRLVSLMLCIQRVCRYIRSQATGYMFLLHTFINLMMVVHWVACLEYGIPRLIRNYFLENHENETWFAVYNMSSSSMSSQYFRSFFKSSAYMLGVQVSKLYQDRLPEEYIMGVITYIFGKIFVAIVWIILAVSILNNKSMDTKFLELINQLDEYMKRKKLPMKLKERISQYYRFKYQYKYVNEELVTSMLSNNLRNEVTMHVCRSLIESVELFENLNPSELNDVVRHLIPEIFLPNDTILQYGTYGDSMYFLSSGTVAVYTYSGKEICHLQDGAYFGEISLLLKGQTRTATVIAIETSKVYRLDRKKFEDTLMKNTEVVQKMVNLVTRRLERTAYIEEQYKKTLFEKTFQRKNTL